MRRKIKGVSQMLWLVAGLVAAVLGVILAFYVFGMARHSLDALQVAMASGEWLNPPVGAGTAYALITIKTTGSITIKSNPECITPQGDKHNPISVTWNVAGQETAPSFTMSAGQTATATLEFPGDSPSVLYCNIQTSRGTLRVEIS